MKAQERVDYSPKITQFFVPKLVLGHRAPYPLFFIPLPSFAYRAMRELSSPEHPASPNMPAEVSPHAHTKTELC